ncbi:MAG TPA: hypothetical protein EYP59_20260, partial [Thiotrichaceae bacterium]|nr:hypothetical protein [Thiotrichaceae bacterium]
MSGDSNVFLLPAPLKSDNFAFNNSRFAPLGDLRENAEYHAARERMSMVSAKIQQLTERLSKLNEIEVEDIPP